MDSIRLQHGHLISSDQTRQDVQILHFYSFHAAAQLKNAFRPFIFGITSAFWPEQLCDCMNVHLLGTRCDP